MNHYFHTTDFQPLGAEQVQILESKVAQNQWEDLENWVLHYIYCHKNQQPRVGEESEETEDVEDLDEPVKRKPKKLKTPKVLEAPKLKIKPKATPKKPQPTRGGL